MHSLTKLLGLNPSSWGFPVLVSSHWQPCLLHNFPWVNFCLANRKPAHPSHPSSSTVTPPPAHWGSFSHSRPFQILIHWSIVSLKGYPGQQMFSFLLGLCEWKLKLRGSVPPLPWGWDSVLTCDSFQCKSLLEFLHPKSFLVVEWWLIWASQDQFWSHLPDKGGEHKELI